jgi:hypothetical protein
MEEVEITASDLRDMENICKEFGHAIDMALNCGKKPEKFGYFLIVRPFGDGPNTTQATVISNISIDTLQRMVAEAAKGIGDLMGKVEGSA